MTDFSHSCEFIIHINPATRRHKLYAFEKASLNKLRKSNSLKEVDGKYANCATCKLDRVIIKRRGSYSGG
jgi:hypothetical protein